MLGMMLGMMVIMSSFAIVAMLDGVRVPSQKREVNVGAGIVSRRAIRGMRFASDMGVRGRKAAYEQQGI